MVKYMKKDLDITKPRYSEQNLPVRRPFVISKLHSGWKSRKVADLYMMFKLVNRWLRGEVVLGKFPVS